MTKSSVVDLKTGGSVDSDVRTSTGTFFSRGEDEVDFRLVGAYQWSLPAGFSYGLDKARGLYTMCGLRLAAPECRAWMRSM